MGFAQLSFSSYKIVHFRLYSKNKDKEDEKAFMDKINFCRRCGLCPPRGGRKGGDQICEQFDNTTEKQSNETLFLMIIFCSFFISIIIYFVFC